MVDPKAGVILREVREVKKKKTPAAATTSTSASASAAPPAPSTPKKKLTPQQQAIAARNATLDVISLRVIDEMFEVRPPPAIVKQQPAKTAATGTSSSSAVAVGPGNLWDKFKLPTFTPPTQPDPDDVRRFRFARNATIVKVQGKRKILETWSDFGEPPEIQKELDVVPPEEREIKFENNSL